MKGEQMGRVGASRTDSEEWGLTIWGQHRGAGIVDPPRPPPPPPGYPIAQLQLPGEPGHCCCSSCPPPPPCRSHPRVFGWNPCRGRRGASTHHVGAVLSRGRNRISYNPPASHSRQEHPWGQKEGDTEAWRPIPKLEDGGIHLRGSETGPRAVGPGPGRRAEEDSVL